MTDAKDNDAGGGAEEHKLIAERRAKLAALREHAVAFPNDFRRDALAGELHEAFGERSGEWLDANPTRVTVGGRLMVKRDLGRYVDLIVNEASRNVFRTRARIVRYLRDFLDALDFLEVETPMMQPIPGGAAARPFRTHHNALDLDMYLRIAPELYLKRLIVGGLERVYEINRNFRNEGLSTQHNPEFTMLELYLAYADYRDLMEWIEKAIQGLADALHGRQEIAYQGRSYDLSRPFARLTVEQAIIEHCPGIDPLSLRDLTSVRRRRGGARAKRRRCSTTPTTCARASTACRPPRVSASASTGWSCSSPTRPRSATSSCSRTCGRKPTER